MNKICHKVSGGSLQNSCHVVLSRMLGCLEIMTYNSKKITLLGGQKEVLGSSNYHKTLWNSYSGNVNQMLHFKLNNGGSVYSPTLKRIP